VGSPGAREREIAELEFLVGTACSRTINLLMAPDRDRTALREEAAFLAEKAGRLAQLLAQTGEARPAP
jgi:hypothetical protein